MKTNATRMTKTQAHAGKTPGEHVDRDSGVRLVAAAVTEPVGESRRLISSIDILTTEALDDFSTAVLAELVDAEAEAHDNSFEAADLIEYLVRARAAIGALRRNLAAAQRDARALMRDAKPSAHQMESGVERVATPMRPEPEEEESPIGTARALAKKIDRVSKRIVVNLVDAQRNYLADSNDVGIQVDSALESIAKLRDYASREQHCLIEALVERRFLRARVAELEAERAGVDSSRLTAEH